MQGKILLCKGEKLSSDETNGLCNFRLLYTHINCILHWFVSHWQRCQNAMKGIAAIKLFQRNVFFLLSTEIRSVTFFVFREKETKRKLCRFLFYCFQLMSHKLTFRGHRWSLVKENKATYQHGGHSQITWSLLLGQGGRGSVVNKRHVLYSSEVHATVGSASCTDNHAAGSPSAMTTARMETWLIWNLFTPDTRNTNKYA